MSSIPISRSFTAFAADRQLGSGPIATLALKAKPIADASPATTLLFFDDDTGRQFDLNLRGSEAEVLARLAQQFPDDLPGEEAAPEQDAPVSTRGRPKLGVIAREVTLLPRHWEWLNRQPGSSSVALRKLVDEARHRHAERDAQQRARQACFGFMSALAGNQPHFEEACRALYVGERQRFQACIDAWPTDIRRHALHLADRAFSGQMA